jgi:hypothetical protein
MGLQAAWLSASIVVSRQASSPADRLPKPGGVAGSSPVVSSASPGASDFDGWGGRAGWRCGLVPFDAIVTNVTGSSRPRLRGGDP